MVVHQSRSSATLQATPAISKTKLTWSATGKWVALLLLLLPSVVKKKRLQNIYAVHMYQKKLCNTRDLPGVALVITFDMTLFTVHSEITFLNECAFSQILKYDENK